MISEGICIVGSMVEEFEKFIIKLYIDSFALSGYSFIIKLHTIP